MIQTLTRWQRYQKRKIVKTTAIFLFVGIVYIVFLCGLILLINDTCETTTEKDDSRLLSDLRPMKLSSTVKYKTQNILFNEFLFFFAKPILFHLSNYNEYV